MGAAGFFVLGVAVADTELQLRIKAAIDGLAAVGALGEELRALSQQAGPAGEQLQRTGTGADQAAAGIRRTGDAAKDSEGHVAGLASSLQLLASAAVLRQFVEANQRVEGLGRALTQITGDSGKAAAEITYLREASDRLGVSFDSISQAYVGLSAATKGTALEGQQTRQIFEAVAGSFATLGKSSADTEGALLAVQQMISKNVVSAEEFRGQLAERLPGANKAAAESLGVTEQQLAKLLESGQLVAKDFLPAFAAQLKKNFGVGSKEAEGFAAQFARLQNSVSAALTAIGDTGVFKALTEAIAITSSTVTGAVVSFDVLGKTIGILAGAVATLDFSRVGEELDAVLQTAGNQLRSVNSSSAVLGKGFLDLGQQAQGAAQGVQTQSAAATAAAEANAKLSAELTKASVALQIDKQKLQEREDLLSAQAARQQASAEAAAALADAYGDEAAQAEATVLAAQSRVTTLQQEQTAKQEALRIATAELDVTQRQIDLSGKRTEADAQKIAQLQQAVQVATEGVQATQLEIVAAQALVVAKQRAAAVTRQAREDAERDTRVTSAATAAKLAEARAELQIANAKGNTSRIRRAEIALADAEASAAGDVARAKRAEANAAAQALDQARAAAQQRGDNSQAMQDEIDKLREQAELKDSEATSSEAVAGAKDAEATARHRNADAIARERTEQQGGVQALQNIDANVQKLAAGVQTARSSFADATAGLAALGEEAVKLFRDNLHAAGFRELAGAAAELSDEQLAARGTAESLREAIAALDRQTHAGGANETDFWISAWARALEGAKRQVYAAQLAAVEAEDALRKATETGALGYAQIARAAAVAREQGKLLGEERLAALQQAIDAAKQKLEQFTQAARDARDAARQALLQEQGDQAALEQLQFQQEKTRLDEQLKQASAAKNREAAAALAQAIADTEALHKLRMQKIKDEAAERQKADSSAGTGTAGSGTRSSSQAGGAGVFAGDPQQQVIGVYRINLTDRGGQQRDLNTLGDPRDFVQALSKAQAVAG